MVPAFTVLAAVIVAVVWIASNDTPDDTVPAPAETEQQPEVLDPAQEALIDADRYRTRPSGLVPVRIAAEAGSGGYVGLSRWNGRWHRSTSADGLDWSIDLDAPAVGVPDAFRPGRLEGQHHVSLQWQDGMYWGRFVSQRTAGSAGAVLTLASDDATRWTHPPEAIPELDRFEFGGVAFGPRSDWAQRWVGSSWFQQSFDGGDSYSTIPWLSVPGPWEPLEIAWSSTGVAVLFYDDVSENYRLAITTDAHDWETIALRERGRNAVHLVVVGTEAVLLSAADPGSDPIELIVPLTRQ